MQGREAAVRRDCEQAGVEARAELSNAKQELAVKVALADSWEREVQQLCRRLEKVLLPDATTLTTTVLHSIDTACSSSGHRCKPACR